MRASGDRVHVVRLAHARLARDDEALARGEGELGVGVGGFSEVAVARDPPPEAVRLQVSHVAPDIRLCGVGDEVRIVNSDGRQNCLRYRCGRLRDLRADR